MHKLKFYVFHLMKLLTSCYNFIMCESLTVCLNIPLVFYAATIFEDLVGGSLNALELGNTIFVLVTKYTSLKQTILTVS